MRIRGKNTKLFLIMLLVLAMLSPVSAFAADNKTVEVKGYLEEGMNEPDLSVSNVFNEADVRTVDESLDAFFDTKSPTVVTTLNDTAIFDVYKMTEDSGMFKVVGDPMAVSGKVKIFVPGATDSADYQEKIIDASELKNYEVDFPTYIKGCTVTLTEPGYYLVNFRYEALAGSTDVMICVWGDSAPEQTPAAAAKADAKPTASKVLVNGTATSFEAYNINGNNYFKLRDIAKVVSGTEKQFDVEYNSEVKAINLLSSKAYTVVGGEMKAGDGKVKNAVLNTAKIYKDGQEVALTAYNINGNNYFKLRDLARSFNIGVTWDGKANTVGIDTSMEYTD